MNTLRAVDDVLAELLADVGVTLRVERRHLDRALNCCAAADVISPVNVPPAANSAMDGYAIARDSLAALGKKRESTWIDVVDRIPAGSTGGPLPGGKAARIFTGAPLPEGADTIVIQEDTEVRGEQIRILEMPAPGDNVRAAGQDIEAGSTVISQGTRLDPRRLGLLASVGVAEVDVYEPLKVAILSTGNELVEPGGKLAPGQIFNSNRYVLSGLLRSLGFEVQDLGIVGDNRQATEDALRNAARSADCILTTGGVSVGEEDHVKAVVETLGEIKMWKLAIKPGKPLAYGQVVGVPFFGLPGNPVSTFVTFVVLAKPYLLAMQGLEPFMPEMRQASAGFSFRAGQRREYLRVRLQPGDTLPVAEKFANQGSGILTSVAWADGLAIVEPGQEVQTGDILPVLPL